MSKRTPRRIFTAHDFVATPEKAAQALVRHLKPGLRFYEPCCGEGDLIRWIEKHSKAECVGFSDIRQDILGVPTVDASTIGVKDVGASATQTFITNPPWGVDKLHPIILRLVPLRPTWLLLYSDWIFTRQAVPFHGWIRKVVTMPRVIWIKDTKSTGFDNCCWILFDASKRNDFMQSGWDKRVLLDD
jgi:hypothetical protein